MSDGSLGYGRSAERKPGVNAATAATSVATCGPNMSSAAITTTNDGAMTVRSLAAACCTRSHEVRIAASVSAATSSARPGSVQPASCGTKTELANIAASATTPRGGASVRIQAATEQQSTPGP